MRTFVDASTIIALSKIGELELLKKLLGKIHITKSIERELLRHEFPETDRIREAVGDWIVSDKVKGDTDRYVKYGLEGRGNVVSHWQENEVGNRRVKCQKGGRCGEQGLYWAFGFDYCSS